MADPLRRLLEERDVLLADGATGTNLFALGLATGEAPELWNATRPERVQAHYRSFVDAGSDIVLTNSFGGTHFRLGLHGSRERVGELNEQAARLAREVVAEADRTVLVAGSMGPTGELFEPLGRLTHVEAVAAFREQAEALARGGADILWLETLSSQAEVDAALEGAAAAGRPVICTVSFDTNGRTMMGVTPRGFAERCARDGHLPAAFGSNCGVGAAELVAAILNMGAGAGEDAMLVAKANCGIPEWRDGALSYNGTPRLMAEYAVLVRDCGARVVGGCCGTTPEHVRAMREALDTRPRGAGRPGLAQVIERLGPVSTGARAQHAGDLDRLGGASGPGHGTRNRRRRGGADAR